MTTPRSIKQLRCTCPVCGEQWVVSHTGRLRRRCLACHFTGPAEAFPHDRLAAPVPKRSTGTAPATTADKGSARQRSGSSSDDGAPPRPTLGDRLKRIL